MLTLYQKKNTTIYALTSSICILEINTSINSRWLIMNVRRFVVIEFIHIVFPRRFLIARSIFTLLIKQLKRAEKVTHNIIHLDLFGAAINLRGLMSECMKYSSSPIFPVLPERIPENESEHRVWCQSASLICFHPTPYLGTILFLCFSMLICWVLCSHSELRTMIWDLFLA